VPRLENRGFITPLPTSCGCNLGLYAVCFLRGRALHRDPALHNRGRGSRNREGRSRCGQTIEKGAHDTGNSTEKSAHDTGETIEKAVRTSAPSPLNRGKKNKAIISSSRSTHHTSQDHIANDLNGKELDRILQHPLGGEHSVPNQIWGGPNSVFHNPGQILGDTKPAPIETQPWTTIETPPWK
jgi:hypothetical protein